MPAITIKNIPEPLYKKLKLSAAQHRRSINSELIYRLETILSPKPLDTDSYLARIRETRNHLSFTVGEQELNDAKSEGRK